ncbi:basic salivary proline-rich protein 3-like [Cynocephalus volans]|uniref:basic salivary proline-rich protein 3-like n=1 Tax=Cynocephalus volans TaxID=110931 RepID=UPI002FC9EF1C
MGANATPTPSLIAPRTQEIESPGYTPSSEAPPPFKTTAEMGLRMDVGKDQEEDCDSCPVVLRLWALQKLQPNLGQLTVSSGGGSVARPASASFSLTAPPITLVPGAHSRLRFGAAAAPDPATSGCPQAPPGGAEAHVHPSRLTHRPPPRMQTRACTYVHGPHLHRRPYKTALSPRSGPGPTCASRAPGPRTDARMPAGGPGAVDGRAAEPGQPPPRGDPSSLGCGQRVSQAVARKPQGRPVPEGRVQGPAAPERPPPFRPSPPSPPHPSQAIHVSRTARRPEGSARAPSRQIHAGRPPEPQSATRPREPRSPGQVEQRRDPRPRPARRGPAAARSRSTSAQARRAPSPGRPVGAPWGSATRPFPTRRPQTRPKFPRPLLPAGRQASRCRYLGSRPHPPAPPRPLVLVAPGAALEAAGSTKPGATLLAAVRAAAGRRLRSRAGRTGGGAGAGRAAGWEQSPAAPLGASAPPGQGVRRACVGPALRGPGRGR